MWNEAAGTHGLLESVAEELRCDYLSDLRMRAIRPSLCIALRGLTAERFSTREWSDAAQYLTGAGMPDGLTAAQAKKLLLRRLRIRGAMAPDAVGGRGGPPTQG